MLKQRFNGNLGKGRAGYIVLIAVSVICGCIGARELRAQDLKASVSVGQAYPNLSLDMQYYEIKHDPNSEEYLSYYKIIREKIMQKLKGLYRYHYSDGDVYLLFTLNSDGKLDRFDVDYTKSIKDSTLIGIATASLKRSSPFPKFPEALSSPKASFNVVISFRSS
jgi:hypothetical protein